MKVLIDDQLYVPADPQPTDKTLEAALEVRFDSDAGDGRTVRGYLHALLATLWAEQEGFSGKRPFGNSGWHLELYKPLMAAGFIAGTVDHDGNPEEFDRKAAHQYVESLIDAAFFGVKP